VDDAQAEYGVRVVHTWAVVLIDDSKVAAVAPCLEPGQAQVNLRHEQGRVLKEERLPESLVFPAQMELRQLVGFPAPLEPAQRTATAPALPAFRVTVNPKVQLHFHQSYL
jgi:hypothetical protein